VLELPATLLVDCLREELPEEKTPFLVFGVVDGVGGVSRVAIVFEEPV
jgi:hypothetical protein